MNPLSLKSIIQNKLCNSLGVKYKFDSFKIIFNYDKDRISELSPNEFIFSFSNKV
jgi:hypothetical protein